MGTYTVVLLNQHYRQDIFRHFTLSARRTLEMYIEYYNNIILTARAVINAFMYRYAYNIITERQLPVCHTNWNAVEESEVREMEYDSAYIFYRIILILCVKKYIYTQYIYYIYIMNFIFK